MAIYPRQKQIDKKNAKKKGSSNTPFEEFDKASEVVEPDYKDKERSYRLFLLKRMEQARDIRESPHDEFNGMSYTQRYLTNMKSGNSYTPPRKNPEDMQVVTGTTREKKLAIVSAVLNLNFETAFHPFDRNNVEDQLLGEAMGDCVEQSNYVEQWDDKKIYVYNELADQGDVFIEEAYVDEERIDKKKIKISDVNEATFKNFDPKKFKKVVFSGCKRNILAGPQVYLGNIRIRDISDQPFIITREIMAYEKAKAIYGHLPRWKNVPRDLVSTDDNDLLAHWGLNWRLENVGKDMVEILKYQDKWNDDYQILINGVMQLPVGFPMPWEYGEYNITQGKLEPINAFFAYNKSIPDKTKLDQEIIDEMYRLAVLKTQKSFMPPIANYSTNLLTKSMFLPGKVNNNLNKGEVEVLGGDPGAYSMKPSEFQMIDMIKKFIDQKSIDPLLQGVSPTGNPTATEVTSVMQQAKQKLGLIIFGFIQFHMNLDMLRLYDILENYPKDQGDKVSELSGKLEKKFRTITLRKEIGGRGYGTKRVEFTENPTPPTELYDMQEGIKRDAIGTPISRSKPKEPMKILQISPTNLRKIKYRWFAEVVPSERETSNANKLAFQDDIVKAAQLFGIQSINMDYAKLQWATKSKLNPNFFFTNQTAMPALPAIGGDQESVNKIQESPSTKITRSNPVGGSRELARQGQGV